MLYIERVPNAPCGVESLHHGNTLPCLPFLWFLMHRVELKVQFFFLSRFSTMVPNAPCGVERYASSQEETKEFLPFLMHRVELKVYNGNIVVQSVRSSS